MKTSQVERIAEWLFDGNGMFYFGIAFVGAVIAGVCLWLAGCHGLMVSDGYRVGILQKSTDKGIIFATHEIEIKTEGHRATSGGGMTNIFDASVWDKNLFSEISELSSKHSYQFHYRQHRFVAPWYGATAYEIWKYVPVKE